MFKRGPASRRPLFSESALPCIDRGAQSSIVKSRGTRQHWQRRYLHVNHPDPPFADAHDLTFQLLPGHGDAWGEICKDGWGVADEAIWIADAHRDTKRFVVRADEKLTAFMELESAIRVGLVPEIWV
jgi:hypothetical protein